MKKVSAFLMMAAAAGCASHQSPPPAVSSGATSAPASNLYANVPAEIGAFKLTERTAVVGAPSDSLFRFKDGSRTILSVIVYNVAADVRSNADPQKWTAAEGEKFKAIQDIRVSRGDISAYAVAFSDTARFAVGTSNILEHAITIPTRSPRGIAVEMQYLYHIGGKFVKVRATVPEAGWQQTTVPSFARELARRMAGGT